MGPAEGCTRVDAQPRALDTHVQRLRPKILPLGRDIARHSRVHRNLGRIRIKGAEHIPKLRLPSRGVDGRPCAHASTLQMVRVYFGNTTHLFHTITVRPYLRKLSLKDISVKVSVSGARLYAPRLEDLDIDSHVVHALMDAPDAELNMAPRHLAVTSMDDDAILPLAALLRYIGSELQSFSMTIHEVILEPVWQCTWAFRLVVIAC
jgi:hypothetical protein